MAGATLQDDLDLIAEAAREAGRIAMRYFSRDPEVWMKDGKSPVSEADLAVDRFLKAELLAARPDYGWLSEETASVRAAGRDGSTFVVDPIDGTRAFLKSQETWCVSIAVVSEGRPVAGVLESPVKGESYASMTGAGAFRNGEAITVSDNRKRFAVAGPESMIKALPDEMRRSITPHAYIPSLAYRIAMVADGRLDATFVRPNAHEWDIAAADLLLEEAGGALKKPSGKRLVYCAADTKQGSLVAGSGELLERLRRTITNEA